MNSRNTLITTTITAFLISACGSSDPELVANPPAVNAKGLVALGSDAEFYSALRAGLKAQSADYYAGSGGLIDEERIDTVANSPPNAPTGVSDSAELNAGSADSIESSNNEVTTTNVQEQNVDEQDWVKLAGSGEQLYILQSNYSNDFGVGPFPEPVIEDDFLPTARTSIAVPQTYTTTLKVMGLDSETPDSTVVSELELDLSGRYADGFYLYETAESTSAFISATGNNFWAYWSTSAAFSGVDSLITKVDVTDPSSPSVTASFQFDGQIISSRRMGKHLFVASRYYPTLPGEQPWTQSPEVWAAQVDSADLSESLPKYSRNNESESTPLIDPAQCFVAGTQNSNSYYSPDVITLAVLDLETMELSDSQCFLGATETLYASADAVFLATTEFQYSQGFPVFEGPDIDVLPIDTDLAVSQTSTKTEIHQFDIGIGTLAYAGTGSVKGHLGWNPLRKPFRMSEKDGYLRVATFNDEQGDSDSPILLAILLANGQGSLDTISTLPNSLQPAPIGKPGEQLYASRFLGNRAYLVTFRQTDPLYVIDLEDPANPRIVGEVEIEGYSDYLQPIGQDYLLGIGKDAVVAADNFGDDGRGALIQGVKLSLFNVSNPASPTEVQSVRIGQRGTQSNALSDHRAITIQAATEAHPLRVSFGIDVYGESSPERVTDTRLASNYYDYRYSGLHGFEINVGADARIVSKGVLRLTPEAGNRYGAYGVDRSVMVNDALFYITGSGVSAALWNDLGNSSPTR